MPAHSLAIRILLYIILSIECDLSQKLDLEVVAIVASYIYVAIAQANSQGGSVGSEELPSQRKVHYLVLKGPLSCNERSTFKKIRSMHL